MNNENRPQSPEDNQVPVETVPVETVPVETVSVETERFIEPEISKMGFFNRLISIFAAPKELMQNIKEYPVFLPVILVAIVIGLGVIPMTVEYATLAARENYNLSMELFGYDRFMQGAMLAEHDEYGEAVQGLGTAMQIMAIVGIVISPWIMIFIVALFLFVLSKIFRGAAGLGQIFSMYAHIYVVVTVGAAVVLLLAVMNDSIMDFTSLAPILMPYGNISQPLFLLLTFVSVFRVWEAALIFVGLKTINDFSAGKAGIITGIFMLFYLGISMSPMLMWMM